MKTLQFIFAGLVFTVAGTSFAAPEGSVETAAPESTGAVRNYPGGADEEDLKIQAELPTPTVTVDRRSIEKRVLKNFLKNSSDSEPPTSESGTSN